MRSLCACLTAHSKQSFKDPEMTEKPTDKTFSATEDPGAFEALYAELEETVRRLEKVK